MSAQSPSSSPRLPSPPPIAEDQISPSANSTDDSHGQIGASNTTHQNDQAATRRIRPGTKAEQMQAGPPLIPLGDIDSAFQLTEHLKALHSSHVHPASSPTTTHPLTKETARRLARAPPGVDRGIWLYELCRFLTQKANAMVIGLFSDSPACSASTCPEMRASEWQYLCAAHEPPKSCCAIDYCCHTLDWCATSLTSTKLFPSRLSLGTETTSTNVQVRKMTEVFRRVYRIFAHAWFSHREAFWRVERETGIYVFFKAVCDEYRLIQEDNYTIPPEAEGVDEEDKPREEREEDFVAPGILRRDTVRPEQQEEREREAGEGNTTKRHKHGQSSTGSVLASIADRNTGVSTVIHEEVEEDEEDVAGSPDHEVGGTGVPELIEEEAEKGEGVSEDAEGYETVVEISEDETPKEDAELAESESNEQDTPERDTPEETPSEEPAQTNTEESTEEAEDKEAEEPVLSEAAEAEEEPQTEKASEEVSESATEKTTSESAREDITEPVMPIDDATEDFTESEAAAEAAEEKTEEKKREPKVTETTTEASSTTEGDESKAADAADADEAGKTVSD